MYVHVPLQTNKNQAVFRRIRPHFRVQCFMPSWTEYSLIAVKELTNIVSYKIWLMSLAKVRLLGYVIVYHSI